MKVLRLVLLLLVVSPGHRARLRDDASRARRASRRQSPGAQVRPGRAALEGQRRRLVPDANRRGTLERLARRCARGRRAGRANTRAARERVAARQPVLDRALQPNPGAHVRPDQPCPRVLRLEPGRQDPAEDGLEGGLAADHHAGELARGREDSSAQEARLRRRVALRGRPPHGRLELVQPRAVGVDRARDRALPRARERLGRHRLQLPRRQVRPGLRRPVGRCRPQRRRRARAGVQPGVGRRRADRDVRLGLDHTRGSRRARPAPCVAPGRGARRSAFDLQLALDRKPEVPGGAHDHAAHDLGAPGHGVHELPGQPALRRAAVDRARRLADRPAQDVLPRGHGRARRARPLHGQAHGSRCRGR